jgi:hypothetical protein
VISICAVVTVNLEPFFEIFLESVSRKTSLVSEIVICHVGGWNSINGSIKHNNPSIGKYENKRIKNIKLREVSAVDEKDLEVIIPPHRDHPAKYPFLTQLGPSHEHSIGIKKCIDATSNDYIWLCDPDTFFIMDKIDEFYLNLNNNHQIVGIASNEAIRHAVGYFPNPYNFFVQKKHLPQNWWATNSLPEKLKGNYLVPPCILHPSKQSYWVEGIKEKLYYPDRFADTGCLLQIWAEEQKYKWISFATEEIRLYTTKIVRSNNRPVAKFEPKNLLYHAVSATIDKERYASFEEAYKKYD